MRCRSVSGRPTPVMLPRPPPPQAVTTGCRCRAAAQHPHAPPGPERGGRTDRAAPHQRSPAPDDTGHLVIDPRVGPCMRWTELATRRVALLRPGHDRTRPVAQSRCRQPRPACLAGDAGGIAWWPSTAGPIVDSSTGNHVVPLSVATCWNATVTARNAAMPTLHPGRAKPATRQAIPPAAPRAAAPGSNPAPHRRRRPPSVRLIDQGG